MCAKLGQNSEGSWCTCLGDLQKKVGAPEITFHSPGRSCIIHQRPHVEESFLGLAEVLTRCENSKTPINDTDVPNLSNSTSLTKAFSYMKFFIAR